MADITWRTASLPAAQIGVPYEAGLAETGAATAITACSVTSGSLPPGIAVSADFVRLTGTCTATKGGSYTFTLTMTDTAGAVASPSFTIAVVAAASDHQGDILKQPVAAQLAKMWQH